MWLRILSFLILAQGALTAYIPFEDLDSFKSISDNEGNYQLEVIEDESKYQDQFSDVVLPNTDFTMRGVVEPINEPRIEGDNLSKRYPGHLGPNFPNKGKFWVRSGECPPTPDGVREFFCPKPAPDGRWLCVDDHELCDGVKHCPNADDESPLVCMFYKAMLSQISFVAKGITSHSMKTNHLDKK